jgi:hypothetical protein
MNEPEINNHLLKEDLFAAFKAQLKKDFEGAGFDGGFTADIPRDFIDLCGRLEKELQKAISRNASSIPTLLYRVDLSERQVGSYGFKISDAQFLYSLSELIVKRILQKVIFRKTFSPD